MKQRYIFILIISIILVKFDVVKAATERTGYIDSHVHFYTNRNSKGWDEGMLKIGGRLAYCSNPSQDFVNNILMTSNDALSYYTRQGIPKSSAQEMITKLALYHYYLNNERSDLNDEQRYFFGQELVWRELRKYLIFNSAYYRIDAIKNPSIFPCKRTNNSCLTANTNYKNGIINGAEQFYEKNKNSYKGYGTVWTSGNAQPLAEFKLVRIDYDYSIDVACVNCEKTGFNNKAYIIQDTTDWDAILNSESSNINNVKNYYNKGSGIFCREEYQVNFPDSVYNTMAEIGRYFTVNASAKSLADISPISDTISNFRPITVTRIRQCKSKINNKADLTKYEKNNETKFKKNTGIVKLKYMEKNKENSKYSKNEIVLVSDDSADEAYSYNTDNNMLTMKKTTSYTLDSNVYRYVRLQDGLSMFSINGVKNLDTDYKNLGIANLPISFENTTTKGGIIATVQLSYELPVERLSGDKVTIADAYTKDNNYFTSSKSSNIYSKAISAGAVSDNSITRGSLSSKDYNILLESACAKLYKTSNGYHSGLKTCMQSRTSNKAGNCYSQNDLNNQNGYICSIKTSPCEIKKDKYYYNGEEISEEDYNKICPSGQKNCYEENGKYYYQGHEIDKEFYNSGKCKLDDMGDKYCRIETDVNGLKHYYNDNNIEITYETYYSKKSSEGGCCKTDCEYGCCPSGECMVMPGVCPGTGGKKVIYRTIDLLTPFPGQNAETRRTGSNWCAYNVKTQKIDCKYNNAVSNKVIIKDGNGEKVHSESHVLYEVTLDSKTINKIRSYNDKHKYDDFEMTCYSNGKACVSRFLRNTNYVNMSSNSKCRNVNRDTFYSCDDFK